jgi:phenazine biosynthesis protein phzE
MHDLFTSTRPFCLIKRRSESRVLYLSGTIALLEWLDQIPRRPGGAPSPSGGEIFDTLSILPFRQVEELGFAVRHKGEQIISLSVEEQRWLEMDHCLSILPNEPVALQDSGVFSPDDAGYAARVRRIVDEEISKGEGCNFVVPRRFRARLADFDLPKALSSFRRLLTDEYGVYWSFLFYTGAQYFIGATPERHISCHKGVVKMNPISGTLRKSTCTAENITSALQSFLKDPKEIFELLMVTDEELKMMADICAEGGQVVGPMLKEMSKLIHSEYVLTGHSDEDVIGMLRKSMFAATVTGSPIENACRVIYRHDPESRRYYGSALALIGHDAQGMDTLDSPITIRMAEIDTDGNLEIGVGGTLVRNSVPEEEVAETHAKAGALMGALGFGRSDGFGCRLGESLYCEDVMISLSARNAKLSRFWIEDQSLGNTAMKKLSSKRITIVDNEDNFTRMMRHMIRAMGASVSIVRYDQYKATEENADLVVLGPGPGDPRDLRNPKMARLSGICQELVSAARPLLCVCLGHQILCQQLGFPLVQKRLPFQGVQEAIDLWGSPEYVGFYNAFAGKVGEPESHGLEISYDECTGEIHALRGDKFAGVQFHPESILTTNGFKITEDILTRLLQ